MNKLKIVITRGELPKRGDIELHAKYVPEVGQAYILKLDEHEERFYIDDPATFRAFKRRVEKLLISRRRIVEVSKDSFARDIIQPIPPTGFQGESFQLHLQDLIDQVSESQLPEAVAELLTMFGR